MLATDPPVIVKTKQLMARAPPSKQVMSLAQGIVHWQPPPAAMEAAAQLLSTAASAAGGDAASINGYGPAEGLPALREALRDKVAKQNGLEGVSHSCTGSWGGVWVVVSSHIGCPGSAGCKLSAASILHSWHVRNAATAGCVSSTPHWSSRQQLADTRSTTCNAMCSGGSLMLIPLGALLLLLRAYSLLSSPPLSSSPLFALLLQYDIMVTAGANQAFVNVVLSLVDESDRVVLFKPYYFNHIMALQMSGGAEQVWL